MCLCMVLFFQAGTATGTCGTVSWQIEHLDTRLIVMWSVPFNFNLHDSYFAVGMIFNRGRFASSSYWFQQVTIQYLQCNSDKCTRGINS